MTARAVSAAAPVRIVPMATEHLDAVVAIEDAASPTPWTRPMFHDTIDNPGGGTGLVAREERTTVGFAVLLMQAGDAHLMNVAVSPGHRRRRVASALVLGVVDDAVTRAATAVTLEVRASNVAAQRLYHRFGFVPAGVRPRYYAGEDAIIMWTPPLTDRAWIDRIDSIRAQMMVGAP